MTETEIPQTEDLEETTEQEEQKTPQSLYEREVSLYAKSLEEDFESGVERLGFAIFHSLPADQQWLYKEKMGQKPEAAEDFFHLGNAYAAQEDYDKAITLWTQSLKKAPGLMVAHFNMALALEKTGKSDKAKAEYGLYLEGLDPESEEARQIQEHLKEL